VILKLAATGFGVRLPLSPGQPQTTAG